MSIFEKIFEVFYISAAIIWGTYLIADIVYDITRKGKFRWEDIISVTIIINLALFILAKIRW